MLHPFLTRRPGETAPRATIADWTRTSPAVYAAYEPLDAAQDHPGAVNGLEAEHRTHTAFDGAMILFNAVLEISTLPNSDRIEPPS